MAWSNQPGPPNVLTDTWRKILEATRLVLTGEVGGGGGLGIIIDGGTSTSNYGTLEGIDGGSA